MFDVCVPFAIALNYSNDSNNHFSKQTRIIKINEENEKKKQIPCSSVCMSHTVNDTIHAI